MSEEKIVSRKDFGKIFLGMGALFVALGIVFVISIALCFIGYFIFHKLQKKFAEEM